MDILLHCFVDLFIEVEVLTQESWLEFSIDAKHIVHHQHLAITVLARTDADGGDLNAFRYFFCQQSRYLFQYDGKTAGFLQEFCIAFNFSASASSFARTV